MHSAVTALLLLAVASAHAIPPQAAVAIAAPAVALAAAAPALFGGHRLIRGVWNAPHVNTVAAINSGAISAANVAGLRAANHWANAHAASWNDANSLARQINQQQQANRAAALQAARDQANAINQLAALSHASRVNEGSRIAQQSGNQAGLRQAHANQATAAQLNAINGGAARDAGVNQYAIIRQIGAVNANAAIANAIRYPVILGGWGAPAPVVTGHAVVAAPAAVVATPAKVVV